MRDVITITEAAGQHIAEVLRANPGNALVVGFDNKGCSGHKYTFFLCAESEIPEGVDAVAVPNGRVVVDPHSLMGLLGATLDLQVDQFSQQLVWDNPMAVSSCGCGDSFQLDSDRACGQ